VCAIYIKVINCKAFPFINRSLRSIATGCKKRQAPKPPSQVPKTCSQEKSDAIPETETAEELPSPAPALRMSLNHQVADDLNKNLDPEPEEAFDSTIHQNEEKYLENENERLMKTKDEHKEEDWDFESQHQMQDENEIEKQNFDGESSWTEEKSDQNSEIDQENFSQDPGLKFQITSYYPFRPVIRRSQKMLEKIDLFSSQVEAIGAIDSKPKFLFQSPTNYVFPPKETPNGKVKNESLIQSEVSIPLSAKSKIQIYEMKMKQGPNENVINKQQPLIRSKSAFHSTFDKFCQESTERHLNQAKGLPKEDFKKGCVSKLTRQFSFESKNAQK